MGTSGKYIYAVLDSNDRNCGIGPVDAGRPYMVRWRDISALVSDMPIVDPAAMPKDALGRLLVMHQQTIEKVMDERAILPLRLATFVDGDDEVRRVLAQGYDTIKKTLHKVRRMAEVDLTATISDFGSFLREVAKTPEITHLKESLLHQAGPVTLEDQMRVGLLIQQRADERKRRLAQQIHDALGRLAADSRAHDLMDERMVLNSAFLIGKDQQENFDDQVEQLNERFDNALNFRRIGPLPPYSFYTLEIRTRRFEDVDWARRQLGIDNDFITVGVIKKAHHRVALTCHPDKNRDVPDIEKKFADMSRAYQMLLDYCRTSGQAASEEGFHLNERTFETNVILVTAPR